MKKKLYTVLCLLLAVALPLAAFAQEEQTDLQLEGFVTEIVDGGFVMEDVKRGEVMLNVSENTVWDGMASKENLAEGQYVLVDFDGRMTFSLPPQAHADRVAMHTLTGVVAEVFEDGMMLQGDPVHGDVIVNFAETMPHVHAGMLVTVWYDGVMALSLPGQVTAKHITVPQITGSISEVTEEGFLLTNEDGVPHWILLTDDTLVSVQPEEIAEEEAADEVAEKPAEEETGEAAEEIIEAELEISEEIIEAEIELSEEPARLPLSQSDVEFTEGSTATVYYNGLTSRSIPAQMTALEIMLHN